MPQIRVRDKQTGKVDFIEWSKPTPPTREEIKTILSGGMHIGSSQMGDYGQPPDPEVGAPMTVPSHGDSSWMNDITTFGSDIAKGARSSLARTVYGGGDLIRRGLGMERIYDQPDVQAARTAPDTWGGTIGSVGGDVAQFAIPGANATKAAKGLSMAGRLAVEGGMGAGVAGIQSAGDPWEMAKGAGIGVVAPPIASAVGRAVSPYVRSMFGRSAQSGMSNPEAADLLLGRMGRVEAEDMFGGPGGRVSSQQGADILMGARPPGPGPRDYESMILGRGASAGDEAGYNSMFGRDPIAPTPAPPRPMSQWEAEAHFGGAPPISDTPVQSPWGPPRVRSSRQLPQMASDRSRFLGGPESGPIDVTSPLPAAAEGEILAGSGATEAAQRAGRRTKPVRGPKGAFRRVSDEEALSLPREDNAAPFIDLPPEQQAPYFEHYGRDTVIPPPDAPIPGGLGDSEYMRFLREQEARPSTVIRNPATTSTARSSVPTREYVGQTSYDPLGLGRVDAPGTSPRDSALNDLLDSVGRGGDDTSARFSSSQTRAASRDAMRASSAPLDVPPPPDVPFRQLVRDMENELGRPLEPNELEALGKRSLTEQGEAAKRGLFPKGEAGEINPELARHIGGGFAGGLFGGLHGDTAEDRWKNAAIGAGLGFGASIAPTLGKRGGSTGAFNRKPPITLAKPTLFSEMGRTRIKREAIDALNAPRAIMASTDLSAPLRQGATMIHRKEYWKSVGPMIKAFMNEDSFKALQDEIHARPSFQKMRESGLALSDIAKEGKLADREELYMSKLAERIPGFGRLIRASGRGYVGFLNKLRADSFDSLMNSAGSDQSSAKAIATYINDATGRGRLPKLGSVDLEKSADALNAALFSPRLMASRINMLNPNTYMKADPFVRKEYLKSIASFGGAVGTVLTLAKGAGAEVETDPRSSDFAKIKIGNTRVDIGAGFQQYIRAAAQFTTGEVKDLESGRIKDLTKKNSRTTRKDIIQNFLEAKASPLLGLMIDASEGKTFTGDKFQLLPEGLTVQDAKEGTLRMPNREEFFKSQVGRRLTPMIIQDLYDLYDEDPELMSLIGPAAFGASVQVHKKRSSRHAQ